MKWKDLKEGDLITILEDPGIWSSRFSNNCPLKLSIYPYTAQIYKIERDDALIGNYGWALGYIKFIISIPTYEIY